MLSGVRGRQVRGAGRRLQGSDGPVSGVSGLRRCMAPAVLSLLLGGCASFPSSMNPVSWWHDLEGGEIAKERPPPPGATEPYPNLASVPPKPEAPDRATLENVTNALIADRTNAQHLAEAAPLADPSSPSASPALFGKGTLPPPPPAPPPGAQTATANISAAEAPPPAPTPPTPASPTPAAKPAGTAEEIAPPPAKAPVGDVQSVPLAPPGVATAPAAQGAEPPPLPTTPPPAPRLPGGVAAAPAPPVASPPAAPSTPPLAAVAPLRAAPAAPPPAAVSPVPPAPAPQLSRTPPPAAAPPSTPITVASAAPSPPKATAAASTISLTFIGGSADLPALAADQLKQLASRRGNGMIAVTGYGDAASNDPDAQAAALTLGLSRAKAMAAALTAAGVPASAVQMDAEAIGRGGSARLVQ